MINGIKCLHCYQDPVFNCQLPLAEHPRYCIWDDSQTDLDVRCGFSPSIRKVLVNNSFKHFGNNRKDRYWPVVVDILLSAFLKHRGDVCWLLYSLSISLVFKLWLNSWVKRPAIPKAVSFNSPEEMPSIPVTLQVFNCSDLMLYFHWYTSVRIDSWPWP